MMENTVSSEDKILFEVIKMASEKGRTLEEINYYCDVCLPLIEEAALAAQKVWEKMEELNHYDPVWWN